MKIAPLTFVALAALAFVCVVSAQTPGAPVIVSLSGNQTVTDGSNVSFAVSVNGNTPFSYQWRRDGVAIPGATASVHSLVPARVADAGTYSVVVSNAVGTVTSGPIVLAVVAPTAPSISLSSGSSSLFVGGNISISAFVTGSAPITIEWRLNGVPVASGTATSYFKANAQIADSGSYTATAANAAGSTTSSAFTVTILPLSAPTIVNGPLDVTVDTGGTISLGPTINTGGSPVSYQWRKDGVAIPGAVFSIYEKSGVTAADAGGYSVVVTNMIGSVTSRTATVSVRPPSAPTAFVSGGATGPFAVGDSFSMSASIAGTPPLAMQWHKDGMPIPGATNSFYNGRISSVSDAGAYAMVVSNALGTATSAYLRVSVFAPRAPVITVHPASQSVEQGDTFSLAVAAIGAPPLSYAWRKDGVLIASATGSSFSQFGRAAASDAAVYTVTVSNAQGSVTSEPAALDVRPPTPPLITAPLFDRAVRDGEAFTWTVQYAGNRNTTTIEWRKNGVSIPGQGNLDSFSRAAATIADAGDYNVTITNAGGSATTSAKITVIPARLPEIVQHPASGSVLAGNSLVLSVNVRGSGGQFGYRWLRDGVAVQGATNSQLTVFSQDSASAGTYRVEVTNTAGMTTSRDAVVTIDTASTRPPIISTSGSASVDGGTTVALQIGTVANYPVQWQRDGANVPNANSNSLSLTNLTPANAGTYTAVVSAPSGTVTSRPIVLSILDAGLAPTITVQPTPSVRQIGDTASFQVTTEGERPLTYQWRKDGVAIPGATAATYSLGNLIAVAAGRYSVAVTNRVGSVVSNAAELSFLPVTLPVFRSHPESRALSADTNTSIQLSAALANSGGTTLQWWKDGTVIVGATSQNFFSSGANAATLAGRYVAVATNSAGSVSSNPAVVATYATQSAPVFNSISTPTLTLLVGSPIFLTANFTRATAFRWRRGGNEFAESNSPALTLNNAQPGDSGLYVLIGLNADGATPATPVQVTIQQPAPGLPMVTAQPRNTTILPGNSGLIFAGIASNPGATYQWRLNGTPISGATSTTLTLANFQAAAAGRYSLVATNSFGSVTTGDAIVTLGTPIAFADAARTESRPAGTAFTLQLSVEGPGPQTYQWRKNGVAIPGATGAALAFATLRPGDAGVYTLVVTNADGSAVSPAYTLAITASPFAGTYYGTFTPGEAFALHVSTEGRGFFVGQLAPGNEAVVAREFAIAGDGSFTFGGTAPRTYGPNRIIGDLVSGRVSGGAVTGRVSGRDVPFAGTIVAAGATDALAGYYQGVPVIQVVGEMHAIIAGDGTMLLLFLDATGLQAGRGAHTGVQNFRSTGPGMTFNVTAGAPGVLSGGLTVPGGSALGIGLGPVPVPGGPERLTNVSARGLAATGGRALIAGFVVSPGGTRDILVRGIGPALAGFGVTGALANPRLRMFRGAVSLLDNDDWGLGGFAPQITSATARVGGFPLNSGSLDAAIITRLDPGGYSAQITGATEAAGVALAEVYDVSEGASGAARIINLSTRGEVGTGADILIVGFVVSGNAAKKILIRGIGPALTPFGVVGVLADPQLRLYRGTQLLRENDNWSSGPDAALVGEAAQAVGAFALPPGSRDSVLLLYLMPGAYSVQLSGVGNTTGIGLVEAYDVP